MRCFDRVKVNIHTRLAMIPTNSARINELRTLFTTSDALTFPSAIIAINVIAPTMAKTSLNADSSVKMDANFLFAFKFAMIGITTAEEVPDKITPVSNEVNMSKRKKINAISVTATEVKIKLITVSLRVPCSDLKRVLKSIFKAP